MNDRVGAASPRHDVLTVRDILLNASVKNGYNFAIEIDGVLYHASISRIQVDSEFPCLGTVVLKPLTRRQA